MASSRKTGTGEDVDTYDSAGGKDYAALQTWEDATDNNNVTGTVSPVLECYNGPHDDKVWMAGATNNATYFRTIRPASGEGHSGTESSGVAFDFDSDPGSSALGVFTQSDNYSQIQDLIVSLNCNVASNRCCLYQNGDESADVGCIMYDSANVGAGGAWGWLAGGSSGEDNLAAINCLADGSDGDLRVGFGRIAGADSALCYNCTAYADNAGAYGFFQNAGSGDLFHWTNCLATGWYYGDFKQTTQVPYVNYCSSGDATADDWDNGDSGNNNINQTFTFVNAAGHDFHLAAGDAGAQGLGTSLSADGKYAFDDDINNGVMGASKAGETRS